MSIESLFDHGCTVYRFSEATRGTTRAKANTYTAGDKEDCAMSPAGFGVRDRGAGSDRTGLVTVYMRAAAVVARNDVLDVTVGPNAPVRLRVITVERPRGHHAEVRAEPFTGEIV